MSSPIVRILISMPITMYSFFPYVHENVLGLYIYIYIIEIKNVRTRKDVHPGSDAIADA